MFIRDIMSTDVQTCRAHESLNAAAQKMWEADIGALPVVDDKDRAVGMLTDRDICMAAYTRGLPLWQIFAAQAMSRSIVTCRPTDTIAQAEELMRGNAIRRLAVVDDGRHVVGVVSMNDLARAALRAHRGLGNLVTTMAAIGRPRRMLLEPDGPRAH